MKTATLSAKQERFATAFARHHNASLACREASYSPGCASVTGTRLLANELVLQRIQELEVANAIDLGLTRQRFLAELEIAATLAKASGQPMAMIAAWREIGKACGFFNPGRIKVDVNLAGSLEMAWMNQLSDAELLKIMEAS